MNKELFTYLWSLLENLQRSVPAGSLLCRSLWHGGHVWYVLKHEPSQRDRENKRGMEGMGSEPCGSSLRLKWQFRGIVLQWETLGLGTDRDLVAHFPRRFSFNMN